MKVCLFTIAAAVLCFEKGESNKSKSKEHEICYLPQNYPRLAQGLRAGQSFPELCFFCWMQEFAEFWRWLIFYLCSSNTAYSFSYNWMAIFIICCREKQ